MNKQGRIYLCIEGLSQLVRSLLPIIPWIGYLMNGYSGYERVFSAILCGTYVVAKSGDLLRTTTLAKDGILELFSVVVRMPCGRRCSKFLTLRF